MGVFTPVPPKDLLLLLRESICFLELDKDQRAQRQATEPAIALPLGPLAQHLDPLASFSSLKTIVINARQIF